MALTISLVLQAAILSWLAFKLYSLAFHVFFHPLRKHPGPLGAAASTWWRTYVVVIRGRSWTHVLTRLHEQYGEVIRIGPEELHFSNPAAFHDIYSPGVRWNKSAALYHSFGAYTSSFSRLTYDEAKSRRDVLSPLFSRRSILNMQGLIRQNVDHLVSVLAKNSAESNTSADFFSAFRCLTIDNITSFCFAKSVNAIDAPHFTTPLTKAMHAATGTFGLLRNFPLIRRAIFSMPIRLAIILSPATADNSRFQLAMQKQVAEVIANPESLKNQPHPIIYHRLLDPEAQKGRPLPSAQSLLDEAQTLIFAGSDTVSNTLMVGFFHLLSRPALQNRLRDQLLESWPELHDPPMFETLETLPLLTAVIKESLRICPNVTTPLERIVPAAGAVIAGVSVPAGTVVSISSLFVHNSAEIFRDPETFDPDRWLAEDSKLLEKWLVPFSKGPRSCIGINLAWCELYIAFATLIRSLDMKIDGTVAEDLVWKDCFIPYFYGKHLRVCCQPVKT